MINHNNNNNNACQLWLGACGLHTRQLAQDWGCLGPLHHDPAFVSRDVGDNAAGGEDFL